MMISATALTNINQPIYIHLYRVDSEWFVIVGLIIMGAVPVVAFCRSISKENNMNTKINVIFGDITESDCEAIVNAANNTLMGGGGVDGAIHAAAGPVVDDECFALNGCQTGEAKITSGGNLKADYIIHTVGPVYDEDKIEFCQNMLYICYKNSLSLAKERCIRSIAFPAISCGVYGYPYEDATEIAISAVNEFVTRNPGAFDRIDFVLFTNDLYDIYKEKIAVD